MKNIKKITSVIAISLAFLTANVMGGVEVEAQSKLNQDEFQRRYRNYLDYVCRTQPNQVIRDIRKTMAYYKRKGKKYTNQSDMDYLDKKFGLDRNKYEWGRVSGPAWMTLNICIAQTEVYLAYKINKTKPPVYKERQGDSEANIQYSHWNDTFKGK
jgi:hypothetical protein